MTIPEKGFYTHYKHNPEGVPNNYTYEVVGVSRNTEDNTLTVLYRPLYVSEWMPPANFQSRPLEMFLEEIEKDGVRMSRFSQVIDSVRIAELTKVRDEMYK